jgi:hypothetical protein
LPQDIALHVLNDLNKKERLQLCAVDQKTHAMVDQALSSNKSSSTISEHTPETYINNLKGARRHIKKEKGKKIGKTALRALTIATAPVTIPTLSTLLAAIPAFAL